MNAKVIFITFVAALAGLLFGFDTAVISGTIPLVKEQYELTAALTGWFVSSALVGSILGVSCSGYLGDKLGRKYLLMVAAGLFLVSAIGCAFSMSLFGLILYRILGGIAIGLASMVAPLYISEISPKAYRGRLVTIYQLAITLGILGAYFSNNYIQVYAKEFALVSGFFGDEIWRGMFAVEVIPAGLFLLGLIVVPKSPRWLALHGERLKAQQISKELAIDFDDKEEDNKEVHLKTLFTGALKKPMGISIFLMLFSQLCGINAIIYYGPSILAAAGFSMSESLGGQVTIGIVNTLFTFLAIAYIDKWGRKPLLLLGAVGVTIALLITGSLFALNVVSGYWVVGSILLFISCYAFSLGPVQFVVASEVFPTNYRAKAMSISTLVLWAANAVVGQVFPMLLEGLGAAATFIIFGIICIPSIYFIKKYIPETKGKSLEEIEKLWSSAPQKETTELLEKA
ncbi:sugar porter family MFS transporter [Flammeovirga kamogawensis]|uniref:Sugar porter family MFS transporter n=1 Tax=Flammeovirga kamogawensis TaxID=373891 RepID=A0ABX8H551_9BACT|nr:sugar porter family MFS transporter [Flammeovirga kamogawensis]MBB6461914.1 sugar porter (SP) family MFS transporter [Flammeovirga kamogawensis]QWG10477.1 sugar porter family MFS transporter [Flammeovirga kamogawensis]TRX63588.1 sugar porter family MFS transporter [Flammeovirga kamogawensis]